MGTAIIKPGDKLGSFQDARNFVAVYQNEIEKATVGQIDTRILASAVLNSVRKTPLLLQCTKLSFLSSVVYCAVTGLLPDTPDQECHLIPFKNKDGVYEVQWIGGFRGFQKLARQSGDVTNITTAVVREKDKFYYRLGLEPRLDHEPPLSGDRGKPVAFYVIFKFANTAWDPQFEVMSKEEVDKVRASSRAKNGPAWTNWYEEQGRKTVFKRGYKWVPKSAMLVKAIELDNAAIIGDRQPLHEIAEGLAGESTRSAADKLADKFNAPESPPEAENASETSQSERKAIIAEIGKLEGSKELEDPIPDSRYKNLDVRDLDEADDLDLDAYHSYLSGLPDKQKAGAK